MKHLIKLNSNENPLGTSKLAIEAAQKVLQHPHLYPDHDYQETREKIAKFYSLAADQIIVGNGSENVLELIIKTFLQKENDNVIIPEYVFSTISRLLENYQIKTKIIPYQDWQYDIPGMINAINENTRMIFLINPGNPVGSYINKSDFFRLMNSVELHVIVVVDEAYAEYMTENDYPDTISFLSRFPNLIVTRTFSKIYGLAAMRMGYALSSHVIAEQLDRSRLPYNVNALAAKAACAALLDQDHVKKSVVTNADLKTTLKKNLQQFNFTLLPSYANFITMQVPDAMMLSRALEQEGILIFPLDSYGLPQYVRISVGTEPQNQYLVKCLASFRTSMSPDLRTLLG